MGNSTLGEKIAKLDERLDSGINKIQSFFSETTQSENLREALILLTHGYCLIHCERAILSSDIITLINTYCFVLDEFDTARLVIGLNKVYGINNTQATIDKDTGHLRGRNIITAKGKYHWTFKFSTSYFSQISVGFMVNKIVWKKILLSPDSEYDDIESNKNEKGNYKLYDYLIEVYLDLHENLVLFTGIDLNKMKSIGQIKYDITKQNQKYRFYINSIPRQQNIGFTTKVELLEYQNSNWYEKGITESVNPDPICCYRYTKCLYLTAEKIKYLQLALKQLPFVEFWNDEYILCLMHSDQIDEAYKHALKYQKGGKGICKLFEYHFKNRKIEEMFELLNLLNFEQIKENNCLYIAGQCFFKLKDKINAYKCFEAFVEKYKDIQDDTIQKTVNDAMSKLAVIHHANGDKDKTLQLFMKIQQSKYDNNMANNCSLLRCIADCYEDKQEYENAIKYYEKAEGTIKMNYSKILINFGYGRCYHKLDDLDKTKIYFDKFEENIAEEQKENNGDEQQGIAHIIIEYAVYISQEFKDYDKAERYLLKALHIFSNDEVNATTICLKLSLIKYKQKDIDTAIKYMMDGLQYIKVNRHVSYYVIHCNLGKFYCKKEMYEQSKQYLLIAKKINSEERHFNGYFGVTLYYLQQYDQALEHLMKFMKLSDNDDKPLADAELYFDVIYAYGQILYQKGDFDNGHQMCLKAMEMSGFQEYENKEMISELANKLELSLQQ